VTELNHLIELNRAQEISEVDTFTESRYRQFVRRFQDHTQTVLDVGCNTGRGGGR
jgi:hypothetical protein